MPDYAKGKIYKITNGDLVYIGSTTQPLSARLAKHRSSKIIYDKTGKGFLSSFDVLGDNAVITLIEDVNCERREQLLMRERFHIDQTNCVNKQMPFVSPEEKKLKEYKYNKDYKTINREAINQRDRLYIATTYHEKRKEITKNYHETHKQDVKDRASRIVICECGVSHWYGNTATHKRTKRHIQRIEEKNMNIV
jgi:CDGSH-type Zn-finger protein